MRRKLISVCLSVAILGAGAAAGYWAWRNKPVEPGTVSAAKAEKVPNVAVRILKKETVQDVVDLTGAVMPWEEVVLSAEVAGPIELQAVEEGDRVTQGQELFRIDTTTLEAKRDEIQAQLDLAKQEDARLRSLARAGIGAQQDVERATAQRLVAEAGLRSINIQIQKSVIQAPFAGVVDRILKERDEFVDPGTPMVRLVQVDKVKVVVGIPERDIVHFKVGDTVAVSIDAMAGRSFPGTVYRIAPTAEAGTRTFPTEIAVDNSDGIVRPGMIARASLIRASYPDSIKVPVFSVISLEDRRLAFVEDGDKSWVRPVEVGVFLGEEVQITEGLKEGDRLIIKGQRELRDGGPVSVQEVQE